MKKRIAIIGAGPIGLEAALAATTRGFDVEIFERGQIADSVRKWGHVRMFSPFGMNSSPDGRARLEQRGVALPDNEALLTGAEFLQNYLAPLAASLSASLHLHAEVVAIGRKGIRKTEMIGAPARAERPFRLMFREENAEHFAEADFIFDCSGTFSNPNPLGDGGLPALGEIEMRDSISYGVPDVRAFSGRRILVVGGGHSAATLVRDLSRIGAETTWTIRKSLAVPCLRLSNDPLAARDELSRAANELAAKIGFRPGTSVHAVRKNATGVAVYLERDGVSEILHVDHIFAATGFRPDPSLARELQVQTCWATEGAYQLAALLLGEEAGDCLATPVSGAETLLHPEPGYFILGMKSYGRSPDFLIRTGHQQIAAVLAYLET